MDSERERGDRLRMALRPTINRPGGEEALLTGIEEQITGLGEEIARAAETSRVLSGAGAGRERGREGGGAR